MLRICEIIELSNTFLNVIPLFYNHTSIHHLLQVLINLYFSALPAKTRQKLHLKYIFNKFIEYLNSFLFQVY